MNDPILVDANSQNISESIVRFTVSKMVGAETWQRVDLVRVHPMQMFMIIENLFKIVEAPVLKSEAEILATTHPQTFCGKPLEQDPEMPEDQIVFSAGGQVICLLKGLAVPAIANGVGSLWKDGVKIKEGRPIDG